MIVPVHVGVKIHTHELTFFEVTSKAYVADFEAQRIKWNNFSYTPEDFYSLLKQYKDQNEEMYDFIFNENVEYLI